MYREVLAFWFEQLQPKDWFSGSDDTDRVVTEKFRSLLLQAAQCELVDGDNILKDGWQRSSCSINFLEIFSVARHKPSLRIRWRWLSLRKL